MSTAAALLTARLHVDLMRLASMACAAPACCRPVGTP